MPAVSIRRLAFHVRTRRFLAEETAIRWTPAAAPSGRPGNRRLTPPGEVRPERSRSLEPMTKIQIAAEIKRIVANQLDDAKRAVKAGTKTIAVNELEDAVRQLKKLAALLEA
jgi:acyl-CoA reductase-like NAD-dependent aldehyde dehydrogenase